MSPGAEGPFNATAHTGLTRKQTVGERHERRRTANYGDRALSKGHEPLPRSSTLKESVSGQREKDGDKAVHEPVAVGIGLDTATSSPDDAVNGNPPKPIDEDCKPGISLDVVTRTHDDEAVESNIVASSTDTVPPVAVSPDKDEKNQQDPVVVDSAPQFSEVAEEEKEEAVKQTSQEKVLPPVDFLILGVHGIGSEPAEPAKNKKDLRRNLKFIQQHWFWELNFRTHVEVIDWRSNLLLRQVTALNKIRARFVPRDKCPSSSSSRQLSDLLMFMSPIHGDSLVESVADQLNHIVSVLQQRPNGRFRNCKIVLCGHSLGGVILYELLTGHRLRPGSNDPPILDFQAHSFFIFGCPLAAFCALREPDLQLRPPILPAGIRVFNIFHPSDPFAFRLEPLLYSKVDPMPGAVRLPRWKTNGPREDFLWDSTTVKAKQIFSMVWNTTGQTFRSMFGGQKQKTDGDASLAAVEGMESPKIRVTLGTSTSSDSALSCTNHRVCQKARNPETRYGAHDKRVVTGQAMQKIKDFRESQSVSMSKTKDYRDSQSVSMSKTKDYRESQSPVGNESEVLPPWLGGRRKAATAEQLMKMLNIPEHERKTVFAALTIGQEEMALRGIKNDLIGTANKSRSTTGSASQSSKLDYVDVISEIEEGGGLELPVRIDFALQEFTDSAVDDLGLLQCHYNYWLSRDAIFFMLKGITNFRPRVSYPDFLQIVHYSEQYETGAAAETASDDASIAESELSKKDVAQQTQADAGSGPQAARGSTSSSNSQAPRVQLLHTRTLKLHQKGEPNKNAQTASKIGAEQGRRFFL